MVHFVVVNWINILHKLQKNTKAMININQIQNLFQMYICVELSYALIVYIAKGIDFVVYKNLQVTTQYSILHLSCLTYFHVTTVLLIYNSITATIQHRASCLFKVRTDINIIYKYWNEVRYFINHSNHIQNRTITQQILQKNLSNILLIAKQ